jgi:hypothetical protein
VNQALLEAHTRLSASGEVDGRESKQGPVIVKISKHCGSVRRHTLYAFLYERGEHVPDHREQTGWPPVGSRGPGLERARRSGDGRMGRGSNEVSSSE